MIVIVDVVPHLIYVSVRSVCGYTWQHLVCFSVVWRILSLKMRGGNSEHRHEVRRWQIDVCYRSGASGRNERPEQVPWALRRYVSLFSPTVSMIREMVSKRTGDTVECSIKSKVEMLIFKKSGHNWTHKRLAYKAFRFGDGRSLTFLVLMSAMLSFRR